MRRTFGYAAFNRNLERLAQAEYAKSSSQRGKSSRSFFPIPDARFHCHAILPCIAKRNLVERFFNKLKHFRAIATRYDKLVRNLLAGIQLASAIILIN